MVCMPVIILDFMQNIKYSEVSDNFKVLAISSLSSTGNAGLKNLMSILGTRIIPVPTLLISGLGNMDGHRRFAIPFKDFLYETMIMAKKNSYTLIVYTGYLDDVSQVDIIIEVLQKFREMIRAVVVDPVCGDNESAYVNASIIAGHARLLALADWALPNQTELRLIMGYEFAASLDVILKRLGNKFPGMQYVITGEVVNEIINNYVFDGERLSVVRQAYSGCSYSGTGDAFAALFIHYCFFQHLPPVDAVKKAGSDVMQFVTASMREERACHDLQIAHQFLSPAQSDQI